MRLTPDAASRIRPAAFLRTPLVAALAVPLLAGCTTIPQASVPPPPARSPEQVQAPPPAEPAPPPAQEFRTAPVQRAAGLEGVIERDAAALLALFGPARLDMREGDMRKLQFAGEPCVLDVYLYPAVPGSEPVATHVAARRASDGREVDSAACVASLRR